MVLAHWLVDCPRSVAHDLCMHRTVWADVLRAARGLWRRMLREKWPGTSIEGPILSAFRFDGRTVLCRRLLSLTPVMSVTTAISRHGSICVCV